MAKLSEEYPEAFAEWVKAEGIERNFEAHLIGIGVLPTTRARLKLLAEQMRSGLGQMAEAIERLPGDEGLGSRVESGAAKELVRAIDVSSHQPRDLSGILAVHDVEHVVVRLYLPWEKPAQEHTRAQVESARALGKSVGGYVWAYAAADPLETVTEGLRLARSCGLEVPVLWIDCETYTEDGNVVDRGPDAAWLRAAVGECVGRGVRPGIYTGAWWWRAYMGDTTEFGEVPLWAAVYNWVADLASVKLFGGWREVVGHQYSANGIDLDVFRRDVVG